MGNFSFQKVNSVIYITMLHFPGSISNFALSRVNSNTILPQVLLNFKRKRKYLKLFYRQEADDEDEDDIEVLDIPENITQIKTIADEQSPVMSLYYKQSDNQANFPHLILSWKYFLSADETDGDI